MNILAGFGKRHLVIALVFALVIQCTHTWYALLRHEQFDLLRLAVWAGLYFVMVVMSLACAVATDNVLGESARPAVRITLAVLASGIVATVFTEGFLSLLPAHIAAALDKERAGFVSQLHRYAFTFSVAAGWSLLLIPLCTMHEASRRATARLHAMRLAALATERRVLEADLRAMQGRVDPELLFDSLLEVDRAYARDVQAGQEALDALIRFLRAALPSDAATTPTVAAEQELAEAYLALVAHRPQVDISVAPEARTLPMPAMLLLPLVRWALNDRSATHLQIHAQRRDAALEVSVRSDSGGHAAAGEPSIAGVRERLAGLFAGDASLDVSVSADARHARLLIPAA